MKLLAGLVFSLALVGLAPRAYADDPSLHEVAQAIHDGRLSEAQSMMGQVLKDHPDSAKAHYMNAEVLVRLNRADDARNELDRAERLAPGLPFAAADSVRSLRTLIADRGRGRSSGFARSAAEPAASSGMSWGPILVILGLGLLLFLFLRARRGGFVVPAGRNALAGSGGSYGPGGYGGTPYGGAPMGGGGLGSGIVGGLATGVAVGAGVVAGEALAHEFIGNHDHDRLVADSGGTDGGRLLADDSGRDFGVSDAGSWDSGSSDIGDIGGGGGDWG